MTEIKTQEEATTLLEEVCQWNPDGNKYKVELNFTKMEGEHAKYNYFYIAVSTRINWTWYSLFTVMSRGQWEMIKQMFVDKRAQEEHDERVKDLDEQAKKWERIEAMVNHNSDKA